MQVYEALVEREVVSTEPGTPRYGCQFGKAGDPSTEYDFDADELMSDEDAAHERLITEWDSEEI
jgi:hypothetical protein